MAEVRTLLIDIETYPNLVWAWTLFKQDIPIQMIEQPGGMLGLSFKWLGEKQKPQFYGLNDYSQESLAKIAWEVLDAADVVEHYNGKTFDVPILNTEFKLAGLGPPSPFKQVDLCNVSKSNFRFASNKLQFVTKILGLEGKMQHSGFVLWRRCMSGVVIAGELDRKAWAEMAKYNIQDVIELEELHPEFLPWIGTYPNVNLYTDDIIEGCPRCGSTALQKRGFSYTYQGKFQRFYCSNCKGWSKSTKRIDGVTVVEDKR